MQLTADNVQHVTLHCLYTNDELIEGKPPDDAVRVTGIINGFGFHPQRLESHRSDVSSMLGQLDEAFTTRGGGGWTFLNACMTNEGQQWGEQRDAENLFSLGIGLGLCSWGLPRDMWPDLPGGVPYVVIDSEAIGCA